MGSGTRWVVVGYGMGAHHAMLIDRVPGLTLRGVCDIREDRRRQAASDRPSVCIYETLDQVLSDSHVDGVVVVTPHVLHAEMVIRALDAGKHAITDKAMCLTVEEARAMIAARDRSGRMLSVFHNRRWDPDFLTVRRAIAGGLVGQVHHIDSCVASWGSPGGWRQVRAEMGGWLYDWGAHTLDQLLLLVPSRPMTVYAFAHYRATNPNEVEDYMNCTVTFENGVTATTVISYLNRIDLPRWSVMGETGAVMGQDFGQPLRLRTTTAGLDTEMSVPLISGDWVSFYQNVDAHLSGVAPLEVYAEQIVPQIAISEASYRSTASGCVERVEF